MTPSHFRYAALPMRVRFGIGAVAQLGAELRGLGLSRALVLCTAAEEALAGAIVADLPDAVASVFPRAVMHVPDEAVNAALDEVGRCAAHSRVGPGPTAPPPAGGDTLSIPGF